MAQKHTKTDIDIIVWIWPTLLSCKLFDHQLVETLTDTSAMASKYVEFVAFIYFIFYIAIFDIWFLLFLL